MFYYALCFYFFIIIFIAIVSHFSNRNLPDFLLANKSLSAPVIGIGAGTADMSGWLMMGLPGIVFIFGLNQVWIVLGLIIGSFFNWHFVSKRLRTFTGNISNCFTIPSYVTYRFSDKKGYLRLFMSITTVFFFVFYASAGFMAAGKVCEICFSFTYQKSLLYIYMIILIYILLGGFLALSWIDFFQGIMILFSLFLLPYLSIGKVGGITELILNLNDLSINFSNIFYKLDIVVILSSLCWGLGYFGQTHILVRFMAIKFYSDIKSAKVVGTSWITFSLCGAFFMGFSCILLFRRHHISNPENIFIQLSKVFYKGKFIGGLMIGALLSAIISTIAAQIIAATSSIIKDIFAFTSYLREMLDKVNPILLSRLFIIFVSFLALIVAINPNSSVLNSISYAWAGMGASFGPLILLSLFFSRITLIGAISGVVTGACLVILMPNFMYMGGFFRIYELLPGFILSALSIFIISIFEINCRKIFFKQHFVDNIFYNKMLLNMHIYYRK